MESTGRPVGGEHGLPEFGQGGRDGNRMRSGAEGSVKPFSSAGFSALTVSEGSGRTSQQGSS